MDIVYSPIPNSYTVGRQGNATIVVSTGLIAMLDDAELDAVLAHELAHVLNRDVTVMTMAVAPFRLARALVKTLIFCVTAFGFIVYGFLYFSVGAVTIVAVILLVLTVFRGIYDWIVTIAPFVGPGPIFGNGIIPGVADVFFGTVIDNMAGVAAVLVVGGLLLIPVVLALGVYYIILSVVPRHLSIYREYAADRGAALLTGNPTAVANALETLADTTRPTTDRRQTTEMQALCLLSNGISREIDVSSTEEPTSDDSSEDEAVLQYIPTGIVAHPPIEDRIAQLQEISRELETQ